MHPTLLYRAYVALTRVALPMAARIEARKLARAGMPPDRAGEKRGHATLPRPEGQLVWFHAASVGESLSVLSLIEEMGRALPEASFLITSGTATSAALVAKRMPPRCCHQFAPLDAPGPLDRFLSHWRPDAVVFVESELWPQMLWRSHTAGVPLALVNARLSERSLKGWRKRPRSAAMLLSVFRVILTQTEALAQALIALGADPARVAPSANLKSLSAPLPLDTNLLAQMRDEIGDRPVWVAASTHEGEEDAVLSAHARLLDIRPDLLLILAPRHPERGPEVARLITAQGWPAPRRGAEEVPGPGPVFLADTMGELGTWYALTGIVYLGGGMAPKGGHNPFEVAQAGAAVLSGPHIFNFQDSFAAILKAGGAQIVAEADELAHAVATWLDNPDALAAARSAATGFAQARAGRIGDVAKDLIAALELGDG